MQVELVLYPQVLINVTTKEKLDLSLPPLQQAVKQAEDELKGSGRVLLRASGTEPKIRVMVEGQDAKLVQELAEKIAVVVTQLSQA